MPYARLISCVYLALVITEQRTIVNEKHGSCLKSITPDYERQVKRSTERSDFTDTITYVAHYFARFREFSTFLTTPCSA